MSHAAPDKQGQLPGLDTGELCRGWSRPETNQYDVQTRTCKCGRGRIVKITRLGLATLFVPFLDEEPLPPYFKLSEAKEAIDAAAAGEELPEMTRPKYHHQEYRTVSDPEAAKESYERTKEWIRSQVSRRPSADPFGVLELEPGATLADARRQFRKLQAKYHPDKNPGDEEAVTKFREVTEAWAAIQQRIAS